MGIAETEEDLRIRDHFAIFFKAISWGCFLAVGHRTVEEADPYNFQV